MNENLYTAHTKKKKSIQNHACSQRQRERERGGGGGGGGNNDRILFFKYVIVFILSLESYFRQ